MIYFLITVFILITIFFIFILLKQKYRKFLIKNSISLNNLLELNRKYNFHIISQYNDSQTYDNEKFFDNISCQDFLIYQLQFKKSQIKENIEKCKENKNNFILYKNEVKTIDSFGTYLTFPKHPNSIFLKKLEVKLFKKNIQRPVIEYKANITLYLSKINGNIYKNKKKCFSAQEILILIKRLNNKNGAFYNDREIWNSICRVERGRVSNKIRFSIYKRDGYRCRICGRSGRFTDLEIDHIKPIAKGGKSTYDNLQTLCKSCNKKKGANY